ncbi:hypothetical protein, partial [Methanocalculus sp.]|uniref:hypothetical protein n=1 Tax=Methanocalculus sp. TaxID=2004547 RepID=UPI002612B8E3
QLSPPASNIVLRYESPRELFNAANTTPLLWKKQLFSDYDTHDACVYFFFALMISVMYDS